MAQLPLRPGIPPFSEGFPAPVVVADEVTAVVVVDVVVVAVAVVVDGAGSAGALGSSSSTSNTFGQSLPVK